jgi:hypothetical protein
MRHLPREAKEEFETTVTPLLREKAGASHDPWNFPNVSDVQTIINKVYGDGKYEVSESDAFYGLVRLNHYF